MGSVLLLNRVGEFRTLRQMICCLCLCVLSNCLSVSDVVAQTAAGQADPGVAAEKPAAGPAVEFEGRWLVPYETKIPGTDVTFRMIPVPGGEYQMGSADSESGRGSDEGPVRRVRVAPFWMGECEVTWSEYKLFMQLYRHLKEFQARGVRKVTDANRIDAVTAPTPLYEPDFTFEYG
ncbi:MAG: formylglycine-generating enzyme family protein, partial [Planctomycetaceae bacterium]